MSDNHLPFVVYRPDGFVGVEVGVSDQLTPEEAFELAARISACALEAQETKRKLERARIAETVERVAKKMATRIDCPECGGDGYYKGPRLGDEPCTRCKGTGKVIHK